MEIITMHGKYNERNKAVRTGLFRSQIILTALFVSIILSLPISVHAQASDTLASPLELWEKCQKTLPGIGLTIIRDEIVNSDSDPDKLFWKPQIGT